MTWYCVIDYYRDKLIYHGEQAGPAAAAMGSGTVIGYSETSPDEAMKLAQERAILAHKRFLDRTQKYNGR